MCDEVQNVGAIDFIGRSSKMRISTAFDEPIAESNCVGCGQCAAVCPTGAIVVRNQAGQTVLDGNGIVTEGLGATKIYKPGQTGNYATIGGSYGDFNLYHNNQASPWFYIQDSGPYPGPAGMFVCGTNGFLNFSQSITEPYGTWDFTHCTPQNLNVVAKFA
jgi:ferredoxin